jgi:hypothetical protein
MFAQTDGVPDSISSLYTICGGKQPTSVQLTELLVSLLSDAPKDFLVIDALDECKEEEGDRERTMFFEALHEIKGWVSGPCSIFITSRPEADIQINMDELGDTHLEAHGTGVDDDIRAYVSTFLRDDLRMKKWPESVKDLVLQGLTEKADGM